MILGVFGEIHSHPGIFLYRIFPEQPIKYKHAVAYNIGVCIFLYVVFECYVIRQDPPSPKPKPQSSIYVFRSDAIRWTDTLDHWNGELYVYINFTASLKLIISHCMYVELTTPFCIWLSTGPLAIENKQPVSDFVCWHYIMNAFTQIMHYVEPNSNFILGHWR